MADKRSLAQLGKPVARPGVEPASLDSQPVAFPLILSTRDNLVLPLETPDRDHSLFCFHKLSYGSLISVVLHFLGHLKQTWSCGQQAWWRVGSSDSSAFSPNAVFWFGFWVFFTRFSESWTLHQS